jgi:hypothetical protein
MSLFGGERKKAKWSGNIGFFYVIKVGIEERMEGGTGEKDRI